MKIRTSKLLACENPYDGSTSHFATGINLDLGNNPSFDQLYIAIAKKLYKFLTTARLSDTVTVLWSHNYSHMTGKCKGTFAICDLVDYARDKDF